MLRLEPGTVVAGRYRLEKKLGEGGHALVFAATDLTRSSTVAIKLLGRKEAARREGVARFEREARIVRELTHPNIVQTLGLGRTEDGVPFLVLELLHGETLGARIARAGALDLESTARIGREMLRALAVAHGRGIVHRDIKPENIFLCRVPGGHDLARLLDFGVAHLRWDDGPTLTHASTVLGTPAYMAPEQVVGEAIDATTDLYALGLVLAECIEGRPVMTDANAVRVALQQASTEPVPIPARVRASPLGNAIVRAVDKQRTRRPASALEMLELFPTNLARPLSELEVAPTAIAPIPDELSHDAFWIPEAPEPPTVRGATPPGGVSSVSATSAPHPSSGGWAAPPTHPSARDVVSTGAPPTPRMFEPAPQTTRLPAPMPTQSSGGRWAAIVGAAVVAAIMVAAVGYYLLFHRNADARPRGARCNLSEEGDGPTLGGGSLGQATRTLQKRGFVEDKVQPPRVKGTVARTYANRATDERIVIVALEPGAEKMSATSPQSAIADADGCRLSVVRTADSGSPRQSAEATLKELFPEATIRARE